MAEGGESGYYDPDVDNKIDNDGDDDEKEVDRTRPFHPGAGSTPYQGGERLEMRTFMHEHSGLPETSYEETPLLSAQSEIQQSWDALTRVFPEASATNLEASYSKTRRLQAKMSGAGKKRYDLFTKDRSGRQQLNPRLSKEIVGSLGQKAEEIIAQDGDTIQEQRQRAEDAEEQLKRANAFAAERENEEQDIQNLREKIERTNAQIDAIQEEHGSNLESEAELNRIKQLKKNYPKELEEKKKEVAALEKQAKNKEKAQAKVDRERLKLAQMEQKRNEIEERLNSTKPLDELNERESGLKRQNEEDRAIIQDENTTPSDREAAEARVAERNEELARLQTQIGEREGAMRLRERVCEIFKKYGVTVASIFLAAGITIGAVIGAITNALKAMGKQIANGLKNLGAKAASALPGLIGSFVSFLFRTAGQAIGFLAEHTWLLILALVAFLFQKLMKRR